jgi:hypothetical protein
MGQTASTSQPIVEIHEKKCKVLLGVYIISRNDTVIGFIQNKKKAYKVFELIVNKCLSHYFLTYPDYKYSLQQLDSSKIYILSHNTNIICSYTTIEDTFKIQYVPYLRNATVTFNDDIDEINESDTQSDDDTDDDTDIPYTDDTDDTDDVKEEVKKVEEVEEVKKVEEVKDEVKEEVK